MLLYVCIMFPLPFRYRPIYDRTIRVWRYAIATANAPDNVRSRRHFAATKERFNHFKTPAPPQPLPLIPDPGRAITFTVSQLELQPEPRPAAALGGGGPARSSSSTAAVRSRLRSGSSVPVRCAAASCAGGGALLLRLVNQRTGRRGIPGSGSGPRIAGQCRLSDDATCARRRISVRRSRAKEDYFTLESRNTLQTTRTWAGACTSSAPSESLGRTSIAHDSRSRAPPSLLL